MASSSSFSEDLTCSVCLGIFTDPVTVYCGHSFCRECITLSLKSLDQCPQCRATVPTDRMDYTTNHILKSLAEKAKKEKGSGKDTEAAVGFCPEHDEKLKLFCVTDQQLTCIICRDCERHEGHKFKPIKEAAASIRKEVETLVEKESSDISAIERLAESQNEEIRKSKEKSQQLRIQISSQFQEMQQFLKRREEGILNELKDKENDELVKMRETLNVAEKALTEGREVGEQMKSVLEITDPESFLKSWGEIKMTPKPKSNPQGSDLQVVTSSLSLSYYESHLQLFVWKEMLQMIQPQAERLLFESLQPPDWSRWSNVICSGRTNNSCSCRRPINYYSYSNLCNCSYAYNSLLSEWQANYKLQTTNTVSINQITSEPHYWEIDVEDKNCWTVEILNHSLTCKDDKYTTTHKQAIKEVKFASKPKKIGIYLNNSSSEEVHFFDADTMQHVYELASSEEPHPVSFVPEYEEIEDL